MTYGRFIVSALGGGSGKTILSIGLIAALKKKHFSIVPFKKGPDYIDAGWLAYAAGRPCFNLDTFILSQDLILRSFSSRTSPGDIAVIEGNRGLFDGIDLHGKTSTAELAKLLQAPVILAVDCTKTTRTMAAMILGLMHFDPNVAFGGIVLNRVAGSRHERILTQTINHHCGIPVIGAVPKIPDKIFPERHMGLVPTPEHEWAKEAVEKTALIAEQHIDLDAVVDIAGRHSARPPHTAAISGCTAEPSLQVEKARPCIGIFKDAAFQFYYPENIDALKTAGASVIFISPLSDDNLPDVDGLYIGGGFPETHAQKLSAGTAFKRRLKAMVKNGLPVYAECGGLMYLGESLVINDSTYPMAGVLPAVFGISEKPQGLGYTVACVDKPNPFLEVGTVFKGHEFHYSNVLKWFGTEDQLVFHMQRGAGFLYGRDGVCIKNVLAAYTHIHTLGLPAWASSLVSNALSFMKKKKSSHELSAL
ncbi:MAG: cobyrinate a,c-diamide synthase [Desulfobacterales bacterium]